MKTLFICLGNVARSQMAEAFYNQNNGNAKAISAGVLDFTSAKYVHPLAEVIAVMKEEGIDMSNQKVKLVTQEMVNKADRIYIMCEEKDLPDFLKNEKSKIIFWKVEDPFNSSLENYRIIRNQIKKLVQTISTKLGI